MQFSMVPLANLVGEKWIVVLACSVVIVHAQNAGGNGDPELFSFLLPGFPPCGLYWVLVPHAAPPFEVRYSEKSESRGSIDEIAPSSANTSTPPIFLPFHSVKTPRFPREARPKSRR